MEQYKDINRSLTLQNQELRQQVAQFKQEIVLLNRVLMSEKQIRQALYRHYVRFVGEVSKLCNNAYNDFHQTIEDFLPEAVSASQSDSLRQKGAPRRSVRLVQPTLRLIQDHESDKENRKLSDDEDDDSQISYVQTRRRPKGESLVQSQAENTPSLIVESINSSSGLEVTEHAEKSMEDDVSETAPRNIHTIREENTADMSQSLMHSQVASVQSLSRSNIVDDSSIQSITLLPNNPATIGYQQHVPSISIIDVSREQPSQVSSKTIRCEQSALAEDTMLDNFRTLKAVSSTPYKPAGSKVIRQCAVRVKRLKQAELPRFEVLIVDDSPKRSNQPVTPPQKRKRRKNVSPVAGLTRVSSESFLTSMTLIERSSEIDSASNTLRPKRNAAPTNLKEPNIFSKLRRNI